MPRRSARTRMVWSKTEWRSKVDPRTRLISFSRESSSSARSIAARLRTSWGESARESAAAASESGTSPEGGDLSVVEQRSCTGGVGGVIGRVVGGGWEDLCGFSSSGKFISCSHLYLFIGTYLHPMPNFCASPYSRKRIDCLILGLPILCAV